MVLTPWGEAGVTGNHDVVGTLQRLQSLSGDLSWGRLHFAVMWLKEPVESRARALPSIPSHPSLSRAPHWSLKHCNPPALLHGTIRSPTLTATAHLTFVALVTEAWATASPHRPLVRCSSAFLSPGPPLLSFVLILGDFNSHRNDLPTLWYPPARFAFIFKQSYLSPS